eukprot:1224659-Alexandrium_andersonii.AAC.1
MPEPRGPLLFGVPGFLARRSPGARSSGCLGVFAFASTFQISGWMRARLRRAPEQLPRSPASSATL